MTSATDWTRLFFVFSDGDLCFVIQPAVTNEDEMTFSVFENQQVVRGCVFMGKIVNCSLITRPVFDQNYGRCFLVDVQRPQMIGSIGLLLYIDLNTGFGMPNTPNLEDGIQVTRLHFQAFIT